jgi:hypothetical protein
MLIQSLIRYFNDIITHCDDWSLYYNVIITSYNDQSILHKYLTLNTLLKHYKRQIHEKISLRKMLDFELKDLNLV